MKTAVVLLALSAAVLVAPSLMPRADEKLNLLGPAIAIDGDTIDMRGFRIRIFGIDAPELDQPCFYMPGNVSWRCGIGATQKLAEIIAGKPVHCIKRDTDRYGRIVAVCLVSGTDIGSVMVREGWAVAYRKYSTAYVDDERAARLERRGLWAGRFQAPSEYRAERAR